MKFIQVATGFLMVVLTLYIIKSSNNIFLVLITASLLSYSIIGLTNVYRNKFAYKKYKLPSSVAFVLSLVSVFGMIYFTGTITNDTIQEIATLAPVYQKNLVSIMNTLIQTFNIQSFTENINPQNWINIPKLLTWGIGISTTIAKNTGSIIIYTFFIILEHQSFSRKFPKMFSSKATYKKVDHIIKSITQQVNTYFRVKVIVSLITAMLCYTIMAVLKISFAPFFAFIIFVLNFIPVIGSLIAIIFPMIMSLIQFQFSEPYTISILIIGLVVIQFLIGNIIEPRYLGESLNLSPIAIILSLTIWGAILGPPGMIICVPTMVVIKIILAQFNPTKPFAVLLSSNGHA